MSYSLPKSSAKGTVSALNDIVGPVVLPGRVFILVEGSGSMVLDVMIGGLAPSTTISSIAAPGLYEIDLPSSGCALQVKCSSHTSGDLEVTINA
jgi:hypothetical protein